MRDDSKAWVTYEQPVLDCGDGRVKVTKYCHGVAIFMLYDTGWFI